MVDANLIPKDDSYYQLSRPELVVFIPPDIEKMKVLEIGCGAGNFKKHMTCLEYWGVEPTPVMAEHALLNLDVVLVGNFETVENEIPNNYFDLVICNDVIEHMIDVDYFLKGIQTKMKPNGLMLGSIPNVRFAENIIRFMVLKDWRYTEWGILDKTHLRFFTQKSLRRLFEGSDFQLEKFEGINPIKLKFGSPKSFLLNLALLVISFLCGTDSRYFQFGFLVKKTSEESIEPPSQ